MGELMAFTLGVVAGLALAVVVVFRIDRNPPGGMLPW